MLVIISGLIIFALIIKLTTKKSTNYVDSDTLRNY